jgi:arylsulfatase A-like enzyme
MFTTHTTRTLVRPAVIAACLSTALSAGAQRSAAPQRPNVIFILTDDHRHDFMGFTGKVPWLETPNMDRMAREGVWVRNATVTTALCSPSRASLLTGQYAHTHTVVDNFSPLPANLRFFPEYLQTAGYRTAFFGKWHMGNQDDQPQKGFHHWESFRGQGVYYNPVLNIDGKRVKYGDSAYITDLLTDHAIDWMNAQDPKKPFFLYLSHKGVHDNFLPARRHAGRYKGNPIRYPSTINLTAGPRSRMYGDTLTHPRAILAARDTTVNIRDIPEWVWRQRDSWHGVDYLYDGRVDFDDTYRRYCETLLGIDDNIGKVLDALKASGKDRNTVVIYMGDNGFLWGEHGLIDKRNMYDESQKVPMLVHGPGRYPGGTVLSQVVQNIDLAPTVLDMAGIPKPAQMQGESIQPLLRGEPVAWRDRAFYEYYWEFSFPQTPTTFGLRKGRYKFIWYHGIWDLSEFFDLEKDPEEKNNLYRHPAYQALIREYRTELWDWLEKTGGAQIPLKRILEQRGDHGYKGLN